MSSIKVTTRDVRALTQEEAISNMKIAAPNYDYSKFVYVNEAAKSTIVCPVRGEVQNSYRNIVRSGGRVKGLSKRKTNEEYIVELTEALKNTGDLEKYDLSKINYVKATTKVTITCLKHGDKEVAPFHLLNGRRCGECKGIKLSNLHRAEWEKVKEHAKAVWGDLYDYSEFMYVNNYTQGIILCKKPGHGSFTKSMGHHIGMGQGCPTCKKEELKTIQVDKGIISFLEISSKTTKFKEKYTYDNVVYNSRNLPVMVTCKDHGDFPVTPYNHAYKKSGCPKCSNSVSAAEMEIRNFVISLGLAIECNTPILNGLHIDIFIPSLKIGIEYCGVWWHREEEEDGSGGVKPNYHKNKYLLAKSKNIQLIQIFEDEWINTPEKVKTVLKVKLGKEYSYIPARKTMFEEVTNIRAKALYSSVHMQGGVTSLGKSFGLTHEGTLLSCMSFSVSNVDKGIIDLARFASMTRVPGGFSKLLKNSIPILKKLGIHTIISFSDNRWSDGGVYEKNGFTNVTKDEELVPRYWWIKGIQRFHKRGFQRKSLKIKFGKTFREGETEYENCKRHGYHRIYDAGVTKWEMKI